MRINTAILALLFVLSFTGAILGAWVHDTAMMLMDGVAAPLFGIAAVAAWLTVIFQVGR